VRSRERQQNRERERESVCVCVCVCDREKALARETAQTAQTADRELNRERIKERETVVRIDKRWNRESKRE
jgi:folate-dependent phosphoribosylglycinamide formyltransferase PurN